MPLSFCLCCVVTEVSGSWFSVMGVWLLMSKSLDLIPEVDSKELVDELLWLGDESGLCISREVAEGCVEHLMLVLEANKVMNLTRIVDVHDALVLHILDSLTLLPCIDSCVEGAVLDMGTGAGFPGIPLCLATERSFTLLDSVGKKVKAVDGFIAKLGLSDRCVAAQDRVESFASERCGEFAVVTARAMSSLPVLVEYAAPLLTIGGSLVVSKGNPSDEELSSGKKAAKICGLQLVEHAELELPRHLGHRVLLRYEKSGNSSIPLPRPVGTAKKSPLA